MNVILCEDVDNLGSMGDQVKVANGYARNFLLPRKLAVVADSAKNKIIRSPPGLMSGLQRRWP